jgi:hypothetical protein
MDTLLILTALKRSTSTDKRSFQFYEAHALGQAEQYTFRLIEWNSPATRGWVLVRTSPLQSKRLLVSEREPIQEERAKVQDEGRQTAGACQSAPITIMPSTMTSVR